jgi:CobQ-like glutamine amidotransferase family enzyme
MIEFFSFAPSKLNLNGDQANLLVLRKRLEWLGQESTLTVLDSLGDLQSFGSRFAKDPEGKFLLLGHGSRAAMESFASDDDEIRRVVLDMAESGLVGLAIGSGYELLSQDFKRVQRVSDYADVPEADGLPRLHGYVNSDTDLAPVARLGENFLGTLVHGPVLARTPELADFFIGLLGVEVRETLRSAEVDGFAAGANAH